MNSYYHYYCIAIGVLVGVFIQFSSLCANTYYYVLLLISQNTNQESSVSTDVSTIHTVETSMTWTFSLLWSLLTSFFGVILLLTLRALVIATINGSSDALLQRNASSLMRNMEHAVASGTLWGVSISWVITDALLGSSLVVGRSPSTSHMLPDRKHLFYYGNAYWYVPAVISFIALLGWHVMLALTSKSDAPISEENDSTTPLLADPSDAEIFLENGSIDNDCHVVEEEEEDFVAVTARKRHRSVKGLSLAFGFLVGIFIQCSTLGATFVGQFVWFRRSIVQNDSEDRTDALIHVFEVMSILWSFITSCMGILLLLCVRALLVWILQYCQSGTRATVPLRLLIPVESFFATGTVLGLNVAWMMTDRVVQSYHSSNVGVSQHWIESLATLVLSSVWCQGILYCTGYYSQNARAHTGRVARCDDAAPGSAVIR